jgi:hypothetical protein
MILYAIVDGEAPLDGGLRLVSCGEVRVVVGDSDPGPATPQALAAHDAVVRRLAERFEAILPVRFGERVEDEAGLAKLLEPRAARLAEALETVRGCAQMTLRVFGEPGPIEEPDQGGPGTRYLEARRRAQTLPEIAPLLDALRPLVQDERTLRHDQGAYFGTAYHLVRRKDVAAYLDLVEKIRTDRRVTVSGPWAPYAFAPGIGDPA